AGLVGGIPKFLGSSRIGLRIREHAKGNGPQGRDQGRDLRVGYLRRVEARDGLRGYERKLRLLSPFPPQFPPSFRHAVRIRQSLSLVHDETAENERNDGNEANQG